MRVPTTGKILATSTYAISLAPIKGADLKAREKTNKETGESDGFKLAPNGKQTFSLRDLKVMTSDESGLHEVKGNVYVSVIEPTDIDPLVPYDFDGMVWIDHYAMKTGTTITIVAERLIKRVQHNNN